MEKGESANIKFFNTIEFRVLLLFSTYMNTNK